MIIEIPVIPGGVVVLLTFFAPYAVAALNGVLPFVNHPWQRKLVAIGVALLLAAVVIVGYLGFGGELPSDQWASLAVTAVLVVTASYALVTKPSASTVETRLTLARDYP